MIVMFFRAQGECQNENFETGHLFSIVKLNFNVGLFSCIFLFEAIFLSQSAIFCRSKFGIFAHFGRFSTISQSLIWSSKYLFLSVNLNSKVEKHIKEANFAKKIKPLSVLVQKLETAQ